MTNLHAIEAGAIAAIVIFIVLMFYDRHRWW